MLVPQVNLKVFMPLEYGGAARAAKSGSMSARLFWAAIAVLIVVKSVLLGWWPFLALMNMPHDASLFVSQAVSILEGDWLGSYSEYTLAKGPITPLWMALMNVLGIPYLLSVHALYVSASVLFLFAFGRFTEHRGFLLLAFAFLLFNPYSLSYGPIASGFREGLHQPVQLALLALSIILFADFVKRRKVKMEFTVLFGLLFFMFWNNREEGIWILPYLAMLIVAMVATLWIQRDSTDNRKGVVKLAQLLAVPFVIWLAGTMAIAWKNYQEYEVFAVVELKTPEFGRAYGNMIAIEPEQWHPRKTLQPDVLDKVYSLPSGSEIDLNGRERGVKRTLHNTNAVWLFRRSVYNAGYYDKGGAAVLSFYDRLGEEIETACAESKFPCGTPLLNALPPWRSDYTERFLQSIGDVLLRGLINDFDLDFEDYFSVALPQKMLKISLLANTPVRVEEASAPNLPSFFSRTIKIKTKYTNKLRRAYRVLAPVLFVLAVRALIVRIVFIVRTRKINALDVIFAGLGVSVVVLLALFTLMIITGITQSSRLYFLLYPVLHPFLLFGLLALTQDITSLRKRTQDASSN